MDESIECLICKEYIVTKEITFVNVYSTIEAHCPNCSSEYTLRPRENQIIQIDGGQLKVIDK